MYEGSDQQEPHGTSQASSSEDPDTEELPEIKIMTKHHEHWIFGESFPTFLIGWLVAIIKGICRKIVPENQCSAKVIIPS